jgi:hypothetical protein
MIGPMPEQCVYRLSQRSTHHQIHKSRGTREVPRVTWCCRVVFCPKSLPLAWGRLRAASVQNGGARERQRTSGEIKASGHNFCFRRQTKRAEWVSQRLCFRAAWKVQSQDVIEQGTGKILSDGRHGLQPGSVDVWTEATDAAQGEGQQAVLTVAYERRLTTERLLSMALREYRRPCIRSWRGPARLAVRDRSHASGFSMTRLALLVPVGLHEPDRAVLPTSGTSCLPAVAKRPRMRAKRPDHLIRLPVSAARLAANRRCHWRG